MTASPSGKAGSRQHKTARTLGPRIVVCFVAVLLASSACGCSVTRFRVPVAANPLPDVAKKAEAEYAVTWEGENTLRLRDTWPLHSIYVLGWSAFHADLHYSDGELSGSFYLRSRQFPLYFAPLYLDTKSSFVGGLLKPQMQKQRDAILEWAHVDRPEVEFVHGSSP